MQFLPGHFCIAHALMHMHSSTCTQAIPFCKCGAAQLDIDKHLIVGFFMSAYHMAETRHAMQVLDRLTPIEQQLLSQRLTQLRHVLDPGFSPLNWNSLGIPDFVATCNKVSCSLVHTALQCFRIIMFQLATAMFRSCANTADAPTCANTHSMQDSDAMRDCTTCLNCPRLLGLSPKQAFACRQSMSSSLL